MGLLTIGHAQLRRVEEMRISSLVAHVTEDAALIDANRSWLSPWCLDENGKWDIVFQSWILTVGGRIIVIDPCTGNGRPHIQPWFDTLDTPYIERFAAAGVKPDEVDYVFCTHMHHDHCGWNTQLRNGRWVPTFPNARYLFTRREFERWDSGRPGFNFVDFNEGVYERSILPVVEAGLADLVGDTHQVLEGVTIESASGHTLGHAMLHLLSDTRQAFFTGDVFHHPLQLVKPEIQFGPADDLGAAITMRQRLVECCAQNAALIIPAHLPAPHCLRVTREAGRFVFSAGTPTGISDS